MKRFSRGNYRTDLLWSINDQKVGSADPDITVRFTREFTSQTPAANALVRSAPISRSASSREDPERAAMPGRIKPMSGLGAQLMNGVGVQIRNIGAPVEDCGRSAGSAVRR
ncbi:hypothetical protein [Nocardia aurantia]|uniref:hypothetical protein n=1 Tax=Nocardia aurantia TaxID=2585199 RepID=UPI001297B233|nr:hypothetical protein [Nocardia aurantia]